ncbi:MAG: SDR family oxidoreductase, partial [bacterium]|nr:SDR family oxidoreductase [bacterium]
PRPLQGLLELEELGAEVLVEQADVADEQAMRRVVAAATDRWGGLHGVIHAAGVAGGGVIQLKRRETAAESDGEVRRYGIPIPPESLPAPAGW